MYHIKVKCGWFSCISSVCAGVYECVVTDGVQELKRSKCKLWTCISYKTIDIVIRGA